jgi:hypothetical protein
MADVPRRALSAERLSNGSILLSTRLTKKLATDAIDWSGSPRSRRRSSP